MNRRKANLNYLSIFSPKTSGTIAVLIANGALRNAFTKAWEGYFLDGEARDVMADRVVQLLGMIRESTYIINMVGQIALPKDQTVQSLSTANTLKTRRVVNWLKR